jgi:glycosyltransferase involved in cell wall biosynthesis
LEESVTLKTEIFPDLCGTVTPSENDLKKSAGYALRNWFARKRRYYLEGVDHFYAQTTFQKKLLVEDGIGDEKISVIPNMVEKADHLSSAVDGDFVAYAGRISPEKGVETLVQSAGFCPRISFKIAGDYKKMPDLVSIAMPELEFLGHLEKKKLGKFYSDCRIFVMPSIWYEGFPSVVIEAMLHGKPVICSRIGGLPEIVEDGKTGLLFEPGNTVDLAEKIKYLYSRPELCRTMGAAGREKVLTAYSPKMYYKRLMRVYERALGASL